MTLALMASADLVDETVSMRRTRQRTWWQRLWMGWMWLWLGLWLLWQRE